MANWWETPEIEAAKQKALAGGASGVFTLDQLKKLGQTGDMATDWMAGGKPAPGSLVAGGGRSMIDPALKLPAGYYRLPGAAGAYYYNPSSGQVSPEFADWANSGKIERDDLTGMPKALMDQRDSGDVFRAGNDQDPATLETLRKIFEYGKVDGSYQEAQDRVLGLGRFQQFLTDKNGKQMRVGDVPGTPLTDPATAPFTQAPSSAGGFDRLMKLSGRTRDEVSTMLGGAVNANGAPIAPGQYYEGTNDTASTMEDALAANYEKRATMWKGLQEMRSMRGLNPNTGTSDAEKKRIYETYNRITDPAQRAAYLTAQDPGNLTDALRAARYELRSGERDQIASYEAAHPQIEYNATGKFGQPQGMQVKLTSGSATFSDPATGRESFFGSVPKKIEMMKPKYGNTALDQTAKRLGGGIMGGLVGFATGGIPGAFLGAYTGAGGPTTKGSFNRLGDFGKMKGNEAHFMDLKEIGTAVAFARITGSGAMFNKGASSAAILSSASHGNVVGRAGSAPIPH